MSPVVCAPSKKRPHYKQAYIDAIEIQQLVVGDAKSGVCTPRERCLLARAFKELEELKLRLRMKPAPKPIDVTVKPRKQQASSGFSESPAQAKPKRAQKVQAEVETPKPEEQQTI